MLENAGPANINILPLMMDKQKVTRLLAIVPLSII
jgi:hypothetical protein